MGRGRHIIDMRYSRALVVGVLMLLVVVDQLLKCGFGKQGRVVMNHGGVFGLLPSPWWGGLLIVVWLVMVYEWHKMKGLMWVGMGMVVAGGLSNIIDRVMLGGVRDFIYYPVFDFYGNVADIMLFVGAMCMLASIIFKKSDGESKFSKPVK